MLNPFRYGLFAWQLASHKICRWSVPFAMIGAAVANALLARQSAFYAAVFARPAAVLRCRRARCVDRRQSAANAGLSAAVERGHSDRMGSLRRRRAHHLLGPVRSTGWAASRLRSHHGMRAAAG